MKKSRFTESQIMAILKEGEAGVAVAQITRKHGISAAPYYYWKSKYGGAGVTELKRLRELEVENAKLKRMYADLALENTAIPRICIEALVPKFAVEALDMCSALACRRQSASGRRRSRKPIDRARDW